MQFQVDEISKILDKYGTRKGLIAMFCMYLMSELPIPESFDVKIQVAILVAKLAAMCGVAVVAILCLWSLDKKRKELPDAP
jgi:hypothetical protein